MSPDDPRHGSTAGYAAGCRCQPCTRAAANYANRRRLHQIRTGEALAVATYRVTRRLEALQALGWSLVAIAGHMGIHYQELYDTARRTFITRARFEAIDRTYQALSMKIPPTTTIGDRISVAKVRNKAARMGWVPPLAWDDIDHDEAPAPMGSTRASWTTEELLDEYEHLLSFGVSKENARRQLRVGKDRIEQAYKTRPREVA